MLLKKIFSIIEDYNLNSITVRLNDFNDTEFEITDNMMFASKENEENSILIETIGDNLYFESQKNNKTKKITVERKGKNTIVKYVLSEIKTYKDVFKGQKNNKYNSRNIEVNTIMKTFDKNKRQTFEYNKKELDNYYINKETGEVILHDPNVFENYIEQEYKFRDKSGFIIMREKKDYLYFDDDNSIKNTDIYLIGNDIDPNSKEISFGGHFYEFSKELYNQYKQGKCEVSDLWNNKKTKKLIKNYSEKFM